MEEAFLNFGKDLEVEQVLSRELKEIVKTIDNTNRHITASLQTVHSNFSKAKEICSKCKEQLPSLTTSYLQLKSKIPNEFYFKYLPLWKSSVQQDVFILSFMTWIEEERLIQLPELEKILFGENGFSLDIESYLVGVAYLPSELSRLCVNSVIAGNYKLPKKIVEFVKELYSAYQLLNLKNDFLRKKYDGIKYDLKKIEEVNFEIVLRGLDKDIKN
eukprot:TRINITY_DN6516_c0_g1_i1.p1 TRINITY_DN6516_c0_g1~~TRINITY_DN6516_c0_g1_i1.p1  ORF type:complete len:216 (-),score=39.23 TRINITY_DN6516_c0_g1_i1:62-709(-)